MIGLRLQDPKTIQIKQSEMATFNYIKNAGLFPGGGK